LSNQNRQNEDWLKPGQFAVLSCRRCIEKYGPPWHHPGTVTRVIRFRNGEYRLNVNCLEHFEDKIIQLKITEDDMEMFARWFKEIGIDVDMLPEKCPPATAVSEKPPEIM
jgi:hypothetical protein